MKTIKTNLHCIITICLMLIASMAMAADTNEPSPPQGTKEFGDFEINYSTFNSLLIPAEIAQAHNLVRANDQQFINISVRRKSTGRAVPAKIEATAQNLLQQIKNVEFKTIKEPDSVYYIGSLRHTNEETFHLDFSVTPEDQTTPFKFRLTRKLYTEN